MSSTSRPLYHQQDAADLRRLKEAFVSNLQGTTRWEVFCVLSSLPLCLLTAAYIEARVAARLRSSKLGQHMPPKFVFEFCGVVLPLLLLLMSVAPAEPAFLLLFLLWGSLALKLWMRLAHGPAARQHMAHMLQHMGSSRKRFVSAFRGGVMVATSLAILGVDFPAFPRRYAKAEGYGGGVMDVGVGAIIFAGGLVSAVAAGAAAAGAAAAADGTAGSVAAATGGTTVSSVVRLRLLQLWKGVKAAVPLLLLGGAREIATAFVGYQAHLGEYGLNWNFFYTIAAVTLLTLAVPVPPRWLGPLGVALTAAHQVLLSSLDVTRLVGPLGAGVAGGSGSEESAAVAGSSTATASSRAAANTSLGAWMHMELGVEARQAAGFWASNKEGLGSLPGYWALYMLGAAIGHQLGVTCALTAARARAQLHSGSSSGSRPGGTAAAVGEAGRLVWAWVGMWWVVDLMLWGLLAAVEAGVEPVSRRTCNLPYVLWTCAQCLAWLLLVVMAELLTTVICSTSGGCGVTSGSSSLHAPPAGAAAATSAAGSGHAGRGSARRSLEAFISAAAAGGGGAGGAGSHGSDSVSAAGAGGAAAAAASAGHHRPHTPPSPTRTTLQRRSVGRRGGGSSPMAAAAAAAAAITAAGAAAAVGGGSIASGSTAAVAAAATAVVDSSAHHLHHTGSREGSPRKPSSSSTSSKRGGGGGGGSSSHSSPKGGGGGSDKGSPKGQGGSDNITSSSTGVAGGGGGSSGCSTPARSRRPASRLQQQQQQQQQQHSRDPEPSSSYAGSSGGPMRLMLAFNRNMLALFMIANLLTGAVNLSINTLAVDSRPARVIVGLYMLLLCSIAVLLDKRGTTLKPW